MKNIALTKGKWRYILFSNKQIRRRISKNHCGNALIYINLYIWMGSKCKDKKETL